MPTTIETKRLRLRPFCEADIEPSYRMNLEPEVSKYTGDGGIVSKAEIERRIREDVLGDYAKHGFGRFAVELKETGEFIGFCGLKYLSDIEEVDLGYRFMHRFWGKGYATEAGKACVDYGFETLNLRKILAFVLPENEASVHVLDKLGFVYECSYVEDDLVAKQYKLER